MLYIVMFNIERAVRKWHVLLVFFFIISTYLLIHSSLGINEIIDIEVFRCAIGSSYTLSSILDYLVYIFFSVIMFVGVVYIVDNVKTMCFDQLLPRLRLHKFYLMQVATVIVLIFIVLSSKYIIALLVSFAIDADIIINNVLSIFLVEFSLWLFLCSLFLVFYTFIGNFSLFFVITYYGIYFSKNLRFSAFLSIDYFYDIGNLTTVISLTLINVVVILRFCRFLHYRLIERE